MADDHKGHSHHDHAHHDEHAPHHDHALVHNHDHKHHHHGHGHHPAPTDFGRAFVIAIALNSAFVAIEFFFGVITNSTALMADAGHNLSDVLGLLLAWSAAWLARRPPSARFTWGLRNASILAALGNAILLMVACGAIAWEAVQRFTQPPPIPGLTVSLVAATGIAINGICAWLFVRGSKEDLNVRGAYLHMLADAAISLGVMLAGLAMLFTGWNWLDPAVSLAIVLVIVFGTWSLLRESTELALGAIPKGIDARAVETFLREQAGVADIHDLHIWAISTTDVALTVHLVMPGGYPGDQAMDAVALALRTKFKIRHCTLQMEMGTTEHRCSMDETSLPSTPQSTVPAR